jgi:hypothetical protein
LRKINDVGFSFTNGTWYSVEKRIINKSKKARDKTLHVRRGDDRNCLQAA